MIAKEQDSWKIIYLTEHLSILFLSVHGYKRTIVLPTYCSEANTDLMASGKTWPVKAVDPPETFEVPLEKLEK